MTGISPTSGTTGGGTSVTISGTNFTSGSGVTTNLYKKTVTITNASGSTLTDFQILVEFDSESLIAAGKMKSDGGDIRVLSGDETTVLSHWLDDSTINTTSTDLWVKVPSIPTSGTTVVLTYGDLTQSSSSNGDNTFEFFDDFNDGVIDTNKWNIIGSPTYLNEANGYLTITTNDTGASYSIGNGIIAKTYSGGPGIRLETTIRDQDGIQTGTTYGMLSLSNTVAYRSSFSVNIQNISLYQLGTSTVSTDSYRTARRNVDVPNMGVDTTWRVFSLSYITDTLIEFYRDASSIATHTTATYVPNSPLYPALGSTAIGGGVGGTQQHDLIKVRKVVATPPSTSVGAEVGITSSVSMTFGGQAATEVTIVDDTTITAVTPVHAAGAVDVVVTIDGTPYTLSNAFTYSAPQVDSISPSSGTTGGGTSVTISGDYFFSGATSQDSSLDFATADEGNYTQEDATNNTDFTGDAVKLHSSGGETTVDVTDGRTWYTQGSSATPAFSDNDTATRVEWVGTYATIDLGTAKTVWKFRLYTSLEGGYNNMPIKTVNISGSNDGSSYSAVHTWVRPNVLGWQEISFTPSPAYRYWRIDLPDLWSTNWTTYRSIHEIEMYEYTTAVYATSGYVTTTDANQLDTSLWSGISSIAIGQTTPTNTTIKHLVSFDGRTTWKYWNGSAWASSNLVDIGTNGNTKSTLEGLSSSDWSASGGFTAGSTTTFDTASDLQTSDTSVTPTLNQITINYLGDPVVVTFDGLNATNVTVVDEQTITATTPAHGVGAVDIVVTNPDGGTDTLVGGFTYAGPQITSLTPDTGITGGGSTVSISGSNFFDNATVAPTDSSLDFDLADEADYIQQDASTGTDFSNGSVSLAQTAVYGADQTSTGLTHTLQSGSAYGGSSVTALSNNSTDTTGDTATNILVQSGFSGNQGLASIDFGTSKTITKLVLSNMSTNVYGVWETMYIKNFKLQGSNTSGANAGPWTDVYTGVTSASTAGTVDTFTFSNANAYRYYRIYTIDNWGYTNYASLAEWELMESTSGYSQTPSYVATSNTNQLSTSSWTEISGVTFAQSTPANTSITYFVSFDGRSTWKYWNGSSWAASSLANAAVDGMTKAEIEALGSADWAGTGGFSAGVTTTLDFAATLSSTNTSATPSLSQISVQYLGDDLSVTFDGVAGTGVTLVDSSTIMATIPAHAAGAVDVVVTNPDGGTDTLVGGFTYSGPQVSSVTPDSAPTIGGVDFTLTGNFFSNTPVEILADVVSQGDQTTTVTVGDTEYVVHQYKTAGSASFTPPEGVTEVEYLIVGGGGGGSKNNLTGAGGGGGGIRTGTVPVTNQAYTIVVGGGGSGTNTNNTPGTNGGDSTAFGLTAGGGKGDALNQNNSGTPQSNLGGTYATPYAGGGGGAGGAGQTGTGTGGIGLQSSITGTTVYFGGGGGGGGDSTTGSTRASGGSGGGGAGSSANLDSVAGTSNTGGGGGGGSSQTGRSSSGGGSGIVVVRYVRPSTLSAGVPTVTFGGVEATNITFVDSSTLTGTIPAHSLGAVDVVVTNPDGESGTLVNGFTYSGPSIDSIDPTSGNQGGGTSVTITGNYFYETGSTAPGTDSTLDFDTADAGNFTEENASNTVINGQLQLQGTSSNSGLLSFNNATLMGGTGSDVTYGITQDSDGNQYTTGYFTGTVDFDPSAGVDNKSSAGSWDVFVTKMNADGTYGTTYTFGGTGTDTGYGIGVDSSGNIFVTGYFTGTADLDPTAGVSNKTAVGSYDGFFVKIDAGGTFGYAYTFGGAGSNDMGRSIRFDSQDNVYYQGTFYGVVDIDPTAGTDNKGIAANTSVFVTKINADETYAYSYVLAGVTDYRTYNFDIDLSGNVYLFGPFVGTVDFDPTGGTDSRTSAGNDLYLTKMNANGTYGYTYTFGGTSTEYGFDVHVDSSGNIYMVGEFYGTSDLDPTAGVQNFTSVGNGDAFITKLNSNGTFAFTKVIGGAGIDWGQQVEVDSAGNIYWVGDYNTSIDLDPGAGVDTRTRGSYSPFIVVLDSAGTYLYGYDFGSTNLDEVWDSYMDANGNLFLAGYIQGTADMDPTAGTSSVTAAGSADGFVLRMDADLAYPTNASYVTTTDSSQLDTSTWGTIV